MGVHEFKGIVWYRFESGNGDAPPISRRYDGDGDSPVDAPARAGGRPRATRGRRRRPSEAAIVRFHRDAVPGTLIRLWAAAGRGGRRIVDHLQSLSK